jgi:heme/copper-type cytochrome/quinol oxidase subunit 2
VKFPNSKTLWFVLYEIYSYAAAGVLGFYIGCAGGLVIFFGFGLQHPNKEMPVWVSLIAWPVYIVPIILCIVGRYCVVRYRNRKQQQKSNQSFDGKTEK